MAKILCIDTTSNALDFLMRCQDYGHQVMWFDRNRKDGSHRMAGAGIVPKIHDLNEVRRKWLGWADLIYVPDNVAYIDMLEPFRKMGYPIFGPGVEATKMELDRTFGQKTMKDAGIPIMESKTFHDYESAIAYVKKHPRMLVSKPSGDANKALSYVAHDMGDMIYMLQRWSKRADTKMLAKQEGFIIQEKKDGIEMAVGGWYGPGGWSKWVYENWENKKLMNGDLGVATGEMGCYDEATDVLTAEGWKPWREVRETDALATLVGGKTVFETPSALVSYDYVGPMVCWANQTLDICVTPNHQMYVNSQTRARAKDDSGYKFVLAENCTESQYEIQRTAEWEGNAEFPPEAMWSGQGDVSSEGAKNWARFLGIYIADGCASAKTVTICDSHPEKADQVEVILQRLRVPYSRTGDRFNIYRSELARKLKPLGRSWEKRVPGYIRHASSEVISAFLEGYTLGDGNTQANGFRVFYTVSASLAGDIQELLLKIGRVGVVKSRDRVGHVNAAPDGHGIIAKRISYEVIERVKKTRSWLDTRNRSIRMYAGKVYCATVSSHVLYVRRNGKPFWCGNTMTRPMLKSKLADQVLFPIGEHLKKIGYVGYIDSNCMIDKETGEPWPMEWTMRDGWPLRHNIIAQMVGDPAGWMIDLLNGKDTIDFRKEGEVCISVVMAIPDFPYSRLTNKEVSGIPIYNATDKEHVHLSEVMMGEAPVQIGEKVVTMPHYVTSGDYVLVCTGTGDTISGARRSAYTAIKKVKIPNNPFYRTDIGAGRMVKQLPILKDHGYAEGLEM